MATKKKMLQAAAGNAGGAGGAGGAALDITDVFSTYLYEGNGSAQTINNGIALGDAPDDGVYYLSSPSSLTGNNSAVSSVSATVDGTVTLNSGTTKFASNSYDFDGASNIRLSRALIDTASSFCFETWVYFDSTGVSNDMAMLLAQYKSGEDGRLLFGAQNGNLVVRYNGNTVALTAPVSASQWHHVAWSYDGTTHRLFIDGTLEDSTTTDFPIYTGVTTQLGGTDSTLLSGYDLDGRMEDIRITTGDARYTSSFTPPTASLPVTTAVTAGEGGLVWLKGRNNGNSHYLHDSERTITKWLRSQTTAAEQTNGPVTSFNSNGFSLGFGQGNGGANSSGDTFASWTFRKAPKFFTCLTYTGNGVAGRTVSHDLGSTPGMIIVKKTSSSTNSNWIVYHKDITASSYGKLNSTDAFTTSFAQYYWGNGTSTVNPTSTEFTVGDTSNLNGSGETYVAYLFAHNDGDGGFGPDGDQDIIKCGYWDSVVNQRVEVDLGFEPQFVIIKGSSYASDWRLFDNMRGITDGDDAELQPHTSNAETNSSNRLNLTSTGFSSTLGDGSSGNRHIYMAIRRGPLAQPESATEVFAPVFHNDDTSEINVSGGFTADAFISKRRSGSATYMTPRLLGGQTLQPSSTAGEVGYSNFVAWDTQEGVNFTGWWGSVTDGIDWQFKRAPGFCDVVAYTGNGTAGRTVSHNLGVAPEMMWVKSRSGAYDWAVYHKGLNGGTNPQDYYLRLNRTFAEVDLIGIWNDTAPTATDFTVRTDNRVNNNSHDYIAYLFASVDGVSKVGSYTGTGQTGGDINVDCGFTSGARFVMIKRTDASGSWWVADTARGIVSGNEPLLALNDTSAELTGYNMVEPYSSGFIVNGSGGGDNSWNDAGGNYIFYAIA